MNKELNRNPVRSRLRACAAPPGIRMQSRLSIRDAALLSLAIVALVSVSGCSTLEQRWQQFDDQRRQEIGVKTKDYYLAEWGKPAKRARTEDGGDVWTWEFSGYGGAQGWRKTLIFAPDGVLKDFRRDYWPKEEW